MGFEWESRLSSQASTTPCALRTLSADMPSLLQIYMHTSTLDLAVSETV